jgi:hypothetical protein
MSLGKVNPRDLMRPNRITPATKVRAAISVTGGIVSTPILMKVYDAPQSVASARRSASSVFISVFCVVIVVSRSKRFESPLLLSWIGRAMLRPRPNYERLTRDTKQSISSACEHRIRKYHRRGRGSDRGYAGLGSAENLRLQFGRHYRISPVIYRNRFAQPW